MKHRFAAVLLAACALAFACFASAAFAGDHGGGGGGAGHDHGGQQAASGDQQHQQQQDKKQQQEQQKQQAEQQKQQAEAQHKQAEQQKHQQQSSSTGDNSKGVKPSNTTQHDTHAAASSDKTKQYGNGKTAGQIATKAGYGDATLHGPGNSQPHKVNCGGHEVDVHALKHKNCSETHGAKPEHAQKPAHEQPEHQKPEHQTPEQPKPEHQKPEHQQPAAPAPMVSFCDMESPTSGKLETKPADEVVKHELNGTPEEARDIVQPFTFNGQSYSQIWTAANEAIFKNGCNAPATGAVAGTSTEQQSCTTTRTVTEQVVVGVKHFIGPKGSGRYVIIHPNPNSSHYRDKHPDELIYQTVTRTETVPAACSSSSTSTTSSSSTASSTESSSTQTTATQTSSSSSAPASTPSASGSVAGETAPISSSAPATQTSSTGGVLGATSPLKTAKPKASGGVLGATARLGRSVGSSRLPFTGLPLWIFALVAAGLIAVGALTRRAGRTPGH